MRSNLFTVRMFILSALLLSPAAIFAGPLTPPAGPIAPTPGPEPRIAINSTNTPGDADSRFQISQPGSYYLTGNIMGAFGRSGIEIVASGVTIDLNGFELVGVAGSLDGIKGDPAIQNVRIQNGTISGWGDHGVDLVGVERCHVTNVIATANTGSGIQLGSGSFMSGCIASLNAGFIGLSLDDGCTMVDCTAFGNTGRGLAVDAGGTITNCTAYANGAEGIVGGQGATIQHCTSRLNTSHGIRVSSGCTVRNNTCYRNSFGGVGAGVSTTGGDNRIEGNHCAAGGIGIEVNGTGSIIIRNTCAGNTTDWDIAADNIFGPIIDRRTPGSAAVLGFAAAGTLGSTDANANYSH